MNDYIIGTVAYLVIILVGVACVAGTYALVEFVLGRWKP